jgi:hypothetical protein
MAMHRLGMAGMAGLLAGLVACSSTEPGGAGGGGGGGTGGTVPAELVGSWYNGSVSPTNYYNPGSGQWNNAYGEGMFYTFKADGTFEFGYEIQSGSYGCTNTVMWYKSGRVDSNPAAQTVTVRPRVALLNSQDNCHPEWNYEKPIDPSPEQLAWHFGKDAYGYDALLLDFPTGDEIAFYPWNP